MSDTAVGICPDDSLTSLVEKLASDEPAALRELAALVQAYPLDPRLHFLDGSLLASRQDYEAAIDALRRSVELAPGYELARFQLGFLLLTCGEAYQAQEAWGPLHGLPRDNYLRLCAQGLTHLIHDRFDEAIEDLRSGIERNKDVLPLNNDMQLIIDEIRTKIGGAGEAQATSSAHLLLQQAALKSTKH